LALHRDDLTSASKIYQLPPVADAVGQSFTFEKTDSGGNTTTIKPYTAETIIGQTTLVISTQYQTVTVFAPLTGTDWLVTGTTLTSDAATHAALTAAHGATGANVGTTNVQSFTVGAKTFASGILNATKPKITTSIDDSGGNEVIKTPATASAVNEITVTNSATGDPVDISATGGDTNISLTLTPKGTGQVKTTGDGATQWTETALTAANVKALRATPISLVAAKGATKVIEFVSAIILLDYGTTQFAEDAGGSNLGIKYTDGSGVQVSEDIEMTGFITQAADYMTTTQAKKDAIVTAAGSANKALVLHNIGAGEIVTGDSLMRVKVAYRVWTTGF